MFLDARVSQTVPRLCTPRTTAFSLSTLPLHNRRGCNQAAESAKCLPPTTWFMNLPLVPEMLRSAARIVLSWFEACGSREYHRQLCGWAERRSEGSCWCAYSHAPLTGMEAMRGLLQNNQTDTYILDVTPLAMNTDIRYTLKRRDETISNRINVLVVSTSRRVDRAGEELNENATHC